MKPVVRLNTFALLLLFLLVLQAFRAAPILGQTPITIMPATLPIARFGVAYSQGLSASGGTAPYTFTLAAGSLPSGLDLNASGLLAGVPTSSGRYGFVVEAKDALGLVGQQPYTLTVQSMTYLPFILQPYPAPVLNAIINASQSGSYDVTWGAVPGASNYTLLENEAQVVYSGPATSHHVTGKPAGQYCYQVRVGANFAASPWSNTQCTTVLPPPSGHIAFASWRDGSAKIYVMNADGNAQTRVSGNFNDRSPTWSPDGQQLGFVSNESCTYGCISVMRADGTQRRRVSENGANNENPAWSPDGQWIAFASSRDLAGTFQFDIYTMRTDGSQLSRLTSTYTAFDLHPSWSPDGARIAFSSDRSGDVEIWVMNADGTAPTRLTYYETYSDREPAWSPDGQWIAFSSNRYAGNYEIYLMRRDGTQVTRLTNSAGADTQPAWSPDGQYLAFVSERDGNAEIYTMRADGSQQTRLTNNSAADRDPSWAR